MLTPHALLKLLNKLLFDTGKAHDADVHMCCQMVHSKTFAECQDQLYYISRFGTCASTPQQSSCLTSSTATVMLQAEVLYSVCHVSTADKCARHAGRQ